MTIIPVHTKKNIQTLHLNATQVDEARAPQTLKKHIQTTKVPNLHDIILSITKQKQKQCHIIYKIIFIKIHEPLVCCTFD